MNVKLTPRPTGRMYVVTMTEPELLAVRFGLALAHRMQGFEVGGLVEFVRTVNEWSLVVRDRVGAPDLARLGDELQAAHATPEPKPSPPAAKRRRKKPTRRRSKRR